MARFKRRSVRRFGRKAHRVSHKSGGISPMGLVLPAIAYGAGRSYLSNLIAPLTAKLPLGNYADEAVLGVAGYFLAKKGKGIVKQVGTSMLIIEAASIGSQAVGGALSGASVSAGTNPSFNGWV